MKVEDRLYLRKSKSGKGMVLGNDEVPWLLISNITHVHELMDEKVDRDFAVFTVVKKEVKKE